MAAGAAPRRNVVRHLFPPNRSGQAIGKLGDLDYPTRMTAGRTIRRAPAAQAVPALMQAVSEHADGFIRFRALIILTGFNDPRMPDVMEELMASPNDRLREVAYAYFEQHPEPPLAPKMLAALDKEQGEFVRPALVRALAAVAGAPGVTEALVRDTGRGLDFFRSTVIEAVGDYKIAAAVPKLMEIAKIDGPLQDDAATALGKIGDKAALGTLAELQRTASKEMQPGIAAAICLMGSNCSVHINYLEKVLGFAETYPGYQELLRGAAAGLGAIARQGNAEVLEHAVRCRHPVAGSGARARHARARPGGAPQHAADAEDARSASPIATRRWGFSPRRSTCSKRISRKSASSSTCVAPIGRRADGSPTRKLCEQLITKLDF